MGMNEFAPYVPRNTTFVVKSIAPDRKVIKIFNYPILYGTTRDLLKIPGVSESDIRASLVKGTIRNKILANEIVVVQSDIDLLQFNNIHKTFLSNAGISKGLEVSGGSGISPSEHETLRQLIHFIDSGPGDGFASGAIKTTTPSGNPFPTNVTWYLDNSLTTKLVEKIIVYNTNNVPISITWNMYDTDGVTILHTVIDSITYVNNVFETTRSRVIV